MEKKRRFKFSGKGIVIAISSIALFLITIFWSSGKVFAKVDPDTEEGKLLQLYKKFDMILHIDDGFMIRDIGRWVLWGGVSLISKLNNYIEGAVDKLVGVNGFYESPAMEDIMRVVVPLTTTLFLIAIIFLGFQFMMNKIEKREEVILNVCLAVVVVVLIPVLVSKMHTVLGHATNYAQGINGPSMSSSIIKSNVADLHYYAEKNFVVDEMQKDKYRGSENTPPLPESTLNHNIGTRDFTHGNQLSATNTEINITETVDIDESIFGNAKDEWAKDLHKKNPVAYDFLKHKRLPTGENGEYTIMELHKNVIPATNIGKEAYYRYHVNWGTVYVTLLVTTFALGITVIKIGRMMFDIAFTQFFAMFVAVTDLTGGQRTKKVLLELANSFGVMFIMVFIMKLFLFYTTWVNDIRSDIGAFPALLLLIAGAWALMDAPDIVQRMMGLDAGLRSGYGALMGAYAGASLAGKGGSMVKGALGKTASAGAGLAGMMAGGLRSGSGKDSSQPRMPSSGGGDAPPPSGGGGGSGGEGDFKRIPDNKKNQAKKPDPNKDSKGGIGKSNQDVIPSGYDETDSGIIVPTSSGSGGRMDEAIPNMSEYARQGSSNERLDVGGSSSPIGDSLQSIDSVGSQQSSEIPSQGMEQVMDRLDGMQDQVTGIQREVGGYGGMAGGIITGSHMFQRLNHSFQRGHSTGNFMRNKAIEGSAKRSLRMNNAGGTIKRVGRSVAQSGVGQSVGGAVQSVKQSSPVQAIGSAGGAVANSVRSVGQVTSQKAQQITQSAGNAVQTVKNIGGQSMAQAGMAVHEAQESIVQSAPVQAVTSAGSAVAGSVKQIGQSTKNIASSGIGKANIKIHGAQQTMGNALQTVKQVGSQGMAQAGMKVHQTQQAVGKVVQTVQRVGGRGGGGSSGSGTSKVVHRTGGTGNTQRTIKNVGSTQSSQKSPKVGKTKEIRNETVHHTENIRQNDGIRKGNDIRDD